MNFISNFSIKSKLLLIIVIVAVFALGTGLALNLYQERSDLKAEMIREAKLNTTLIGDFSTSQLIFNDKPTAVKTLSKLKNIPNIVFARLYKNPHINFADYGSYNENKISKMGLNGFDKAVFDNEALLYHHKILFEGKSIGSILIIFSTKSLYKKINKLSLLTLLIAIFTIILSYILAHYLQKSISTPILSLADTFNEISNKHDFSQRNFRKRNDEFEILQTGLNEMLAQIRDRESEILESEKRFRDLIEQAPDSIFVFNMQGRIIEVNKNAEKTLGYSREELSAKNIADLYTHKNKTDSVDDIWGRLEKGKSLVIEGRHKRKDGTTFPVEINLGFVEYKEQDAILGFARDITERKIAEELLKTSEEKFRNIFNSSHDAFIIHEFDGTILDVNETMLKMYGVNKEEALQLTIEKNYSSDENDLMQLSQYWEQVLSGDELELEWIAKQPKTDKTFDVQVNLKKINYENREVVLSNVRDISDRKKARREIKKLNEELERKVIARTAELEKINQELKEFAYIVSHDLKAPLRAISKLSHWISEDYSDKLDNSGKEQLALMISRVGRMNNLINGVLKYSRLGRIAQEYIELDLNELIKNIIDTLDPPKNITITFENEFPKFIGDETRILQLFQNIIGNAIKYMDKPDGEIKLRSQDAGEFWKFEISDNGPGIEKRFHEKIFQIFQTLNSRDEIESTGIGLTLVKKIVEMYDGKISVESEIGSGTTFIFTLRKDNNKYFN